MERRALAVIVAVGVLVRLAWCAYAAREPTSFGDPFAYLNHARDIADGAGYVVWFDGRATAYYPPGYPALLGVALWLVQSVTRTEALVVTIVGLNLVAAVVTVVGVHAIGRHLGGPRVGLAAAALAALFPSLVLYSAIAHLELVFTALVVVLVWLAISGPPTVRRAAVVGAVAALAVFVRPVVLPALVVLVVWWWRRFDLRRAVQAGAVVLGVLTLAIAPWSIRSTRALGGFVLVSTNTGDNLCIGHSPESDGQYQDLARFCWPPYEDVPAERREVVRDRENRERAIEYAVEHPRREAWLLWRRAVYLVAHDHEAVLAVESYGADRFLGDTTRDVLRWAADGWYALVGLAGVAGAVLACRRSAPASGLVLGAALALLAVPLAFFGGSRFHVPALPFVCVFAAFGLLRAPRPSALLRRRSAPVPSPADPGASPPRSPRGAAL